jgi:hypothetical protein
MKKVKEILSNDFKDGLSLSPLELESYRISVANRLANDKENNYTSSRTGNMLTIAIRGDSGKIRVYQASGYTYHDFVVE